MRPPCKVIWLAWLILFVSFTRSSEAQITNVLQSRQGAELGAKPCRYDSLPHPSVLLTPARLASLRQELAAGSPARKEIYDDTIKANADRWLKRAIVIPDVGGWGHDFFCTDGTLLELPADQQFDPHLPSKCPVCGKEYLGPKIIAARRFFEHYWLESAERDLAMVYAVEQKKEYADKAAEILTGYADTFPRELGPGGFQGMTLAEAVGLIPLAQGYDLIYDTLTPAQRTHIERDFFWPAAQSLTHAGFRGNWGSWHLSAIGVIGYATRHQRFIDFATAQFKSQITDQLGDDGLWPESIGTYHFYALDGFLDFAEAAANSGDDLFSFHAKGGKGLEAMFEAPLHYAYPNLHLAAINDGWHDAWLPRDQYLAAYFHYHRPEFAWATSELRRENHTGNPGEFMSHDYRYLLFDENVPTDAPRPILAATNFPVLGIAALRQGADLPADQQMMMLLHYGPFLGHGHFDKMGVTLFAQGREVVPDYGTSGYGIQLSQFYQSAPGHNTIVVDGKNQKRTDDNFLAAFRDTPGFQIAAAQTTELVPGTTWVRAIMLMDHYAVIWDRLSGAQSHQFDWFFHADGDDISLEDAVQSSTPPARREFPWPFITDVRKYSANGNLRVRWTSAGQGLDAWLFAENGGTVFTGKYPTPEIRKVPELVLRKSGPKVEFLTVLRPWQGAAAPRDGDVQISKTPDGRLAVAIKMGQRTDHLRLDSPVVYEKAGADPVSVPLKRSVTEGL